MSSINPFPLPAEVLESVAQEALRLMLPVNIQRPRPDAPRQEPAFVDAFEEWNVAMEGSTEGLLNLALGLRPLLSEQTSEQNIEWDLLTNGIEALTFRLRQF